MSLLLAALILVQDPVPGLLAKIDGKDPEACFRAIRELAGLPPDRRPDIEKGAEKLPEFYRLALQAELRAPAARLVTLAGKGKTADGWLEELGKICGATYWSASEEDPGSEGGEFDLALKNVPALEALRIVCERGRCFPSDFRRGYAPEKVAWAATTRRTLVIRDYAALGQVLQAGGAPRWKATVAFEVIQDPGTEIVAVKGVRLFEAKAKGGATLVHQPSEKSDVFVWPENQRLGVGRCWSVSGDVEVGLPERIETIERLQFAAECLYATAITDVDVGVDGEGKEAPVSKDGFTAVVLDDLGLPRRGGDVRVRVTSKLRTPDQVMKMPVEVETPETDDVYARVMDVRAAEGGAVEYRVRLQSQEASIPVKLRFRFATTVETRRVFAEFRDIPLK